ncbi:uncharacterized protein LOC126799743 [Argentina anserina]|uniref:uncharacterized protein LOC126799743 n=1 Tax=Argentina anserina TaxID=57926 RepID=UPI002176226A|nr:uncharacterized protein LOC126799743 [Potentilla anserina]
MKKNPNSNNPTPNGTVVAPPGSAARGEECSNCGTKKGWILHNVRYRAVLRRLCTSCVLRLHPGSFCPFCFLFHQNPQNAPNLVSCSKCPSLSHPDCLPPYAAFSPSPFLCPPCSSSSAPNFSFFRLDTNNNTLDKRLAAVLLCAATIAANSMSKAVAFARAEADRKVREAAAARKRAREALDRFVILSAAAAQPRPAADQVSGSSNGAPTALSNKEANGDLDSKQPH